jgi:hypothetical protein
MKNYLPVRWHHPQTPPPPDAEGAEETPPLFQEIRNIKQRRYLLAFAACGQVRQAARLAQVDVGSHYHWLKHDPDYPAAFAEATRIAADGWLDVAVERATRHERASDLLLLAILNAYFPERFKSRYSPKTEELPLIDLEDRARQANERLMRLRRQGQEQSAC